VGTIWAVLVVAVAVAVAIKSNISTTQETSNSRLGQGLIEWEEKNDRKGYQLQPAPTEDARECQSTNATYGMYAGEANT
jgi:hypothetical protein